MALSKLSNYQLYVIIQNAALDKDIRKLANTELSRREPGSDEIKALVLKHEAEFKPQSKPGLDLKYRILIILFPFFFYIQMIFAARYLDNGQKQKWKDYWLSLAIGHVLWIFIALAIARLVHDHFDK